MEQEKITVAQTLLQELKRVGADTIFGIISIHNIPFFDELLTLARSPELHNMDAFAVLLRI